MRLNISLRVFVRRGIDERFFLWRGSRDDNQVFREQEEESRSLQKGRSYSRGCRYHASCPSAAIMTRTLPSQESWTTSGSSRRVQMWKSYWSIWRFSSSGKCVICYVAHFTQRSSSLTTSVFRQILYCIAHEKRMLSPVEEIERISSISSTFCFRNYFFEFARKETRLDETSGRPHFLVWERMLTHFFRESDRAFFYFMFFCAFLWERWSRRHSCASYRVSLSVCRHLCWKNSVTTVVFSFYAFGMKKPSLMWYSLFVKLWKSTSGQWSIRYVRYPSHLVKCSPYHVDMHYLKQSLYASLYFDDRRRFHPRRESKLLLQKNHL